MADHRIDGLLQLDGEVIVISPDGNYWVTFMVREVPKTVSRPHGLRYSLTLHGPGGERLVGFDNAHPAPSAPWSRPHDHRHVCDRVRSYVYSDAAALLEDFWTAVERVLDERGVIR